jgi:hypothetical protein
MAYAVLTEPESFPFDDFEGLLMESLIPGTPVERYNREWRMGPVSRQGRYVQGRIGFQRTGGTAELWDDSTGDFVQRAVIEGYTSPFDIDIERKLVAFQVRPGLIEPNSFIGAMEALLDEGSAYQGWSVAHVNNAIDFDEWAQSKGRIDQVLIRLERPNPHYGDRESVESVVEGANAASVTIRVVAAKDDADGVNLDDPLLSEAIQHVFAGYGYFTAVAGVRGSLDRWDSRVEGAPPVFLSQEVDPSTKEVSWPQLREALERFEGSSIRTRRVRSRRQP